MDIRNHIMCYCTFIIFTYKTARRLFAGDVDRSGRAKGLDDVMLRQSALQPWRDEEVLDDVGAQLVRGAVSPKGQQAALAAYRVLILNRHAQLIRFFYLECACLADALDSARELAAGRAAELWRDGVLVGRCEPTL